MKISSIQSLISFIFVFILGISTASCANDDNASSNAVGNATESATDIAADSAADNTADIAAESDTGEISDQIAHGEEMHTSHCYKCHTDDVYKRDDRFVKSIDALSKQVVRCKDGTGAPWFDEDTDAVVQFLNKKYYRF